jgi:hypothetical protein
MYIFFLLPVQASYEKCVDPWRFISDIDSFCDVRIVF